MSEKVKIKYRTDEKRCNPEYTEYLEDKKFQLGEHEFTPHRNKNDNTIPVDDMQYEMVRFAIAYIQDKGTMISDNEYYNDHNDLNEWVRNYTSMTRSCINENINGWFKRYGLENLFYAINNFYNDNYGHRSYYYNHETMEKIQTSVRNGDYDVLLKDPIFSIISTKDDLQKITKSVNDYNNVVAENSEINNKLIEILKQLDEKIDENKILQEQKIKLEDIKQKQANIFKKRKDKYNTRHKQSLGASWIVFICICGLIAWRAKMIIDRHASFVDGILPILPLTLSLSVAFYILRRSVYRNEILEIEYEHKEVHAEFYTSLLANDINEDDEEIKQFHRNVYLETLNHNPVENVMKKHKNDDEQTTKLLDKIIEILKIKV